MPAVRDIYGHKSTRSYGGQVRVDILTFLSRGGVRIAPVRSSYSRKTGDRLPPAYAKNNLEHQIMAKFLFIYRESTESRAKPSPEEMQALQGAWYAWMRKFSAAIVPGGDGLKHTGRVVKAGLVTDGPYVEAKEIIVSFTVIQA